jgi:hypothetical protein
MGPTQSGSSGGSSTYQGIDAVHNGSDSLTSSVQALGKSQSAVANAVRTTSVGENVLGPADADTLPAADKLFGPLAVASSVPGVVQGINQIANGHIVQGGANVVGNGSSVGAGAATTATGFNLVGDAGTVSALGTAAGGLGGVSAVADGGLNVYQGVSSGNAGQVATGGVSTVAGGLMIGGAATGDPIMVAAGGALYGGNTIWQNRQAIGSAVSSGATAVANVASTGFNTATGAVSSGVDTATGTVSSGVDTATGAVSSGLSDAGDTISSIL